MTLGEALFTVTVALVCFALGLLVLMIIITIWLTDEIILFQKEQDISNWFKRKDKDD